jgi:uncharacterized OsmC-like protein
MHTSRVQYQGQLRTLALHLQSNIEVITDAPLDNHGKGEAFSPTDLVATALASCMMTIMGIKADDMGIDIANTSAQVTKHMSASPRRISEIAVTVSMSQNFDAKTRKILEAAALTCPVSQSLHSETKQTIDFIYPEA